MPVQYEEEIIGIMKAFAKDRGSKFSPFDPQLGSEVGKHLMSQHPKEYPTMGAVPRGAVYLEIAQRHREIFTINKQGIITVMVSHR